MNQTVVYTKTYGIRKGIKGRYYVVTDIREENGYTYYDMCHNLHYAKPDFAMKKAEEFVKRCYKPFVNFQGQPVKFEFECKGIV